MRALRLLFPLAALAFQLAAADPPVTLLIENARVWTGNPAQPWAEAIAIRGDRIAAVGSNAALHKLATRQTERLDARGRLVTPGFNDAHIHFLGGSQRLLEVDLTGACTIAEMQARIKDWAASNPNAAWIVGGGWEYFCFPAGLPHKADLDAVVKDRPAFLSAYDGHSSWVNSKALAIAGVNKETKFDGFGEIVRDPATGEPTGAFKEGASSLVRRLIPAATREQKLRALKRGMELAASLGITSIQNASGSREEIELWQQIARTGAQTLRVALAMSISPGGKGCAAIADLKGRIDGPMLRVAAVKFMLDGVIESHTAAMLEPYSDGARDRGLLAWDEDAYRQAVAACEADGWQIYTHAIGDRAVRVALDAYQASAARRGAPSPAASRPRIEHIEIIHPSDVPRFGQLGVLASMEPIHADPATVEVWSKAIGPDRLPLSFPWRSIEKAGGRLVFSSDWPASISLDPMRGIHNAVNRQTTDSKPAGGWLPDQRVSLETALRSYTTSAAYAEFQEKRKGTIAPGMLADLIVLSQDLFRIPPQKIHETRVDATVSAGRIVWRR
jgi:predicted amidohydrolase YtcJ